MGFCQAVGAVAAGAEPVRLDYVKKRLRLPENTSPDDEVIEGLITGAREDGERLSGLTIARRQFVYLLDSFPYYTDTVQSQQAYPPSYCSAPRYSTTLWNYSQMIKLPRAPLISVDSLTYVKTDGTTGTLEAGVDFIVDPVTKLARLFPMVGRNWPPCLYVPNAVKILFTAGYDPDPDATQTFSLPSPPPNPPNQQTGYTVAIGIPQAFVDTIAALVVKRYQNWGMAGVPEEFERAFQGLGVVDFAPTRG